MPSSSNLQESLDTYLNDESGVRFRALAHFAEPLFDLYDIDLSATLGAAPEARDEDEMATLLAVLETARLLWAYFGLPDEAQDRYRDDLEAYLLGPDAEAGAADSLQELLDAMEAQWEAMPPHMRSSAEDVEGYALPPFEDLLEAFAPADTDVQGPGPMQGPDGDMEGPEAMALFAQPLLEDPEVQTDPDALEERMTRATAYWELAQLPPDEREEQVDALKDQFAESDAERDEIEAEAERMVDRYHELFATE
jgi:hypothetical protein